MSKCFNPGPFFSSEDQIREFAQWAFGKDGFMGGIEAVDCWNRRHSEKLYINPNDLVRESLPKMIELWREHGKKEK